MEAFQSSPDVALDLAANLLTGTLPAQWGTGAPAVLGRISVADNFLNGSIPSTWGALVAAADQGISVAGNALEGMLPQAMWGVSGALR